MSEELTGEIPTKAGRQAWVGLAVLALPTFVVAIDLFVLLLALPTLAADLGADSVQQLWVSDIYGFLLAGFLISMGTLGDRIGRRKLLIIGGAVFAVASALTAYAPTVELLIVARAGLGIAGATLMPSTIALIGGLFRDPKQQATAFGIWGGVFTMGAAFGPILGGLLLEYFWWGSVFLIAVPFLVAMLVLAPKYLPEFSNPSAGKLDYASVGLSVVALLAVIYGIKELARHGWDTVPLVVLAAGLALGVLFVRRQNRLAEPLLDLKLFRNRVISATLVNQLAFSAVGAGLMLLMLLYFQLVDGMSTLNAALAMVPGMLGGAAGMQLAPKLAARFKPGYVIGCGMFLAALVYVGLTQVSVDNGTWMLIVGFVLASFFGTPAVVLGTGLVVSNAPPEKMGSAGSVAQLSNELGGTLGLAVLGTAAAAVYRGTVTVPADVPAGQAGVAGDSLAGALGTAQSLPADQMSTLIDSARDAFVNGVQTIAIIGAALYTITGLLVISRLKHIPPFAQPAAETAVDPEPSAATDAGPQVWQPGPEAEG
jgi:DHA2 family multidrug resistance protein-like MFS transporter